MLLERRGVVVPYRTSARYAAERCGAGRQSTTVRVADGEPGVECQIDLARLDIAAGGLAIDPRQLGFPLTCTDCGGDMRILAFITAAEPVDAILAHLGLPATAPPVSPARGPPQHDLGFDADPGFDFDQTPAFDLTEPEAVPDFDFDFDQSAGA